MPTPVELYPFSTQDGKNIPLDIVKPLGTILFSMTTSFAACVLPAKYNLSALFSTVAVYIDLTGTAVSAPVSGVDNIGWLYLPANTVLIAELPTITAKIRAVSASGDLYITALQKYAALGLPRQFNTKTS